MGTPRWPTCPTIPLEPGSRRTRIARSQLTTTRIPRPLPGRRDGENPCRLQNGANSVIFGGRGSLPSQQERPRPSGSRWHQPRRQVVICKYLKPNSNCWFAARPRLPPPRRAGERRVAGRRQSPAGRWVSSFSRAPTAPTVRPLPPVINLRCTRSICATVGSVSSAPGAQPPSLAPRKCWVSGWENTADMYIKHRIIKLTDSNRG